MAEPSKVETEIDWEKLAEIRQCELDEWHKIVEEAAGLRGDGEVHLPMDYLRGLLENEARLAYVNYKLRQKRGRRPKGQAK